MGYTHYWSFKPIPKGQAKSVEALYQHAIAECALIARRYQSNFPKGHEGRLSGYSANTNPKQYAGLHINGRGENAHEDFCMREHFKQNKGGFCKTARKPYDLVVVACLATLKYRLGDLIRLGSDGDEIDWEAGVKYAAKVLRRAIQIPEEIGK